MSSINNNCIYCAKECKVTDSKPYPNSKSKERIHNLCHIKKSLADKQAKSRNFHESTSKLIPSETRFTSDLKSSSLQIIGKLNDDNEKLKSEAQTKKLTNLIEERDKQAERDRDKPSFFFDIKAGIAKPHEKRRFLNHRKICEMAPRYDGHGFKEDAVGRSYDHSGKDLNTLGDEVDSDVDEDPQHSSKSTKRKSDANREVFSIKRSNKIDLSKNPCWFCLSSPDVEKHLIIAIGTYCYLTLAKGGLVDEHLLLIPIEHISSASSKYNSKELLAEKERFIEHIVDYFGSKSQSVVFFERNFRSVHWQIQAVPVASKLLTGLHKQIQELSGTHYTKCTYIDFSSSLQVSDVVPPGEPYLHWRIEPGSINFACVIDVKESFFPIQLPRMVLAHILGYPDRVDWKKCCKSRDQYLELVAHIKDTWSKYEVG